MRLTASFCAPAPSILTRTQQYIHGYKTPCFAPLWPVLLHDDSAAKGAAPPTRSQHDARSALKLPPSNIVATSNCETIVGCAHSFLGTLSYPYFRVLIPFPGPTVLLSLVHTCSRPQQLAEHTHTHKHGTSRRRDAFSRMLVGFAKVPNQCEEGLSARETSTTTPSTRVPASIRIAKSAKMPRQDRGYA